MESEIVMSKTDVGRTFQGYMILFDRPLNDDVSPYWSTLSPSAASARARFTQDFGRKIKEPGERVVKVEVRVVEPEQDEVL